MTETNSTIIEINDYITNVIIRNNSDTRDGYIASITLRTGSIVFSIDTYQQCCEDAEYFFIERGDLPIGAKIDKIKIVENINSGKYGYDSEIICYIYYKVNGYNRIENIGISNSHNGYYSHMFTISTPNKNLSFSV